MKKRDLFVFAGQSNMMGAAVLPPVVEIVATDSYEYKHKPRRMGAEHGEFVAAGYPCGEFSYTEAAMKIAYFPENTDAAGQSKLATYGENTYFCPAMSNLKDAENHEQYPFAVFSEATMKPGATMAPLFAAEWEARGQSCAYAHIAKGGVAISHYFNADMSAQYNDAARARNSEGGAKLHVVESRPMFEEASAYFDRKVSDFFADAAARFPGEDQSAKVFVWCQGETNADSGRESYKMRLEILWEHLRSLGFTHFFCVRVGFWGSGDGKRIHEVMQAQEEFCRENENCYIITRAMSLMPYPGIKNEDWFVEPPEEKYENCRDCYFGYGNPHINEKGFSIIAKAAADNALRVLREGKEPVLEKENVKKLL
jgi:hypothetical protein